MTERILADRILTDRSAREAPGVAPVLALSGPPPLPARLVWRMATFWFGSLAIVATVVLVREPVLGGLSAALAAAAMGYAVLGSTTWLTRRAWPHAIAALIAGISAAGLCATKCGTYAVYDTLLGVPTSLAAIGLHGAVTLVVLLTSRRSGESELVADLAIATAIGGSLFYGTVLLISGTWCSACAAIHALMAVQLLELLGHRRGLIRVTVITTILASAGIANALYHHRAVPAARDDADALLAYLRSTWTAAEPPAHLVPSADGLSDVRQEGVAILHQLAVDLPQVGPPGTTPVRVAPRTAPATTATAVTAADAAMSSTAALRPVADANRWGRSTAPVVLVAAIDTGCPVCAQEFGQLLELQDLVEAGRLQVRFLVTYKNDASQATASIAYVAGLLGEDQLVGTLQGVYAHFSEILTAADALKFMPPGMTTTGVVDLLRHHQSDISGLLADAAAVREQLGATGDPALWLMTLGSTKPQRTFQGLTMSAIVRLAANSLDPAAAGP